jgi:hypothetical protein
VGAETGKNSAHAPSKTVDADDHSAANNLNRKRILEFTTEASTRSNACMLVLEKSVGSGNMGQKVRRDRRKWRKSQLRLKLGENDDEKNVRLL